MSDRDTRDTVEQIAAIGSDREIGDLRRRMAETNDRLERTLRKFQDEVDELKRDIMLREQAQEIVLAEVRKMFTEIQRRDHGVEVHRSEAAIGGQRVEFIVQLK